jgi:hypothetical protein
LRLTVLCCQISKTSETRAKYTKTIKLTNTPLLKEELLKFIIQNVLWVKLKLGLVILAQSSHAFEMIEIYIPHAIPSCTGLMMSFAADK